MLGGHHINTTNTASPDSETSWEKERELKTRATFLTCDMIVDDVPNWPIDHRERWLCTKDTKRAHQPSSAKPVGQNRRGGHRFSCALDQCNSSECTTNWQTIHLALLPAHTNDQVKWCASIILNWPCSTFCNVHFAVHCPHCESTVFGLFGVCVWLCTIGNVENYVRRTFRDLPHPAWIKVNAVVCHICLHLTPIKS